MKHTTPDGRILEVHTEEVGYGPRPVSPSERAAELAIKLFAMSSRNRRKLAVGHVWCGACGRELLGVFRLAGEFVGVPGGKPVFGAERLDDYAPDGLVREEPFLFGEKPIVALTCRCWRVDEVNFLDLRVLAVDLNAGRGPNFKLYGDGSAMEVATKPH